MSTPQALKVQLMALCAEYEVFGEATPEVYGSVDLVEHGLIDSMGTVYLQEMISEHYGLEIPPEMFALELRTMDALVVYISSATA